MMDGIIVPIYQIDYYEFFQQQQKKCFIHMQQRYISYPEKKNKYVKFWKTNILQKRYTFWFRVVFRSIYGCLLNRGMNVWSVFTFLLFKTKRKSTAYKRKTSQYQIWFFSILNGYDLNSLYNELEFCEDAKKKYHRHYTYHIYI